MQSSINTLTYLQDNFTFEPGKHLVTLVDERSDHATHKQVSKSM